MTASGVANAQSAGATVSWSEEVHLQSGRVLAVKRDVSVGRGPRGGPRISQSISFELDGKTFEWRDEGWAAASPSPDALEIVHGEPVLFLPVHGWLACYKYQFPQDGMIALRLHNNHWVSSAVRDLPREARVNLLRSSGVIEQLRGYRDKPVGVETKRVLERGNPGPEQGTSVAEAAKVYASVRDSCARIRPAPDAQMDALRLASAQAELNATTLKAELRSESSVPESITAQRFAQEKGRWSGAGYITNSCRGIVERIEQTFEWVGDANSYRSSHSGYELVFPSVPGQAKRVPIQGRAAMQFVVCDSTTVFAIRRSDQETLILHRFTHGGDLVDALRVLLPEAAHLVAGPLWTALWKAVPAADGILELTLADYSYPATAELGGTIRKKAVCEVRLPRH